jgi:hypothetical protein
MSTCAATGDLLQPSYPLVPLERSVIGTAGNAVQLWATYTAVPTDVGVATTIGNTDKSTVGLWFTAFVFIDGKGKPVDVAVFEADLAPMVDAAALPSPSFADVPSGSFNGSGTSFPAGPVGWVSWEGDFMAQRTAGCSAVKVQEWVGSSANVSMAMDDSDGILNIAPLIGGQHALLGEAGKIAAVSTYRFTSVYAAASGGIVTALRGKPSELITLLFATRPDTSGTFACKSQNVTIGADGTASATFPG